MTKIIREGRKKLFDVFVGVYPANPDHKDLVWNDDKEAPDISGSIIGAIRTGVKYNRPDMVLALINHFNVQNKSLVTKITEQLDKHGSLTSKDKARLTGLSI